MSKLKLISLAQTCTACPSQWEGQLEDGRYIYARYRWGHLSVRADVSMEEAVWGKDEIFEGSPDDSGSLDGWMETEEMLELAGLEYDGEVESISRLFIVDTKTGESKTYEGEDGLEKLLEDLSNDNDQDDESDHGTGEPGGEV